MRKLVLLAGMVLLAILPAHAQTAADSAAIRQTAPDYIEGWYAATTSGWRARSIPSWPSAWCAPTSRAAPATSATWAHRSW